VGLVDLRVTEGGANVVSAGNDGVGPSSSIDQIVVEAKVQAKP
jgi:hypothetical protein